MIKVNLSSVTHAKPGYQFQTELDLSRLLIGDHDLTYLKGQLSLTRISDGILIQGLLNTEVKTECTRCLTSYYEPISIELDDVISLAGAEISQERPVRVAENGWADISPFIREYTWLGLPFARLCSEDCKGICLDCGGNRNLGECKCGEVQKTDPRWEVLRTLIDRPENV